MKLSNLYVQLRPHIEWVTWGAALLLMATMNPYVESSTWCLFERIGIWWCPGHGLGHSIAFLARGEWILAVQSHPLGPLAVVILLHRSTSQCYKAFNWNTKSQVETL